jgi:hypothetical protein
MSRYPFSCECGSVFMTASLLAAHKSSNSCKPNATYTLRITARPGKTRSTSASKESCIRCGGRGYIVFGKTKDSKGIVTQPCPNRCKPLTEYEEFVRKQWDEIKPVRMPNDAR